MTLPPDTDVNFPLTITAVSKETSNGDEESGDRDRSTSSTNSTARPRGVEFTALDQSIWSTGDQFTFVDDRFVGVNTGEFNETVGGALFAGVSGHIQLGFQSTLTFAGRRDRRHLELRRHGRDQLQQDHRSAPDRYRRAADRRQSSPPSARPAPTCWISSTTSCSTPSPGVDIDARSARFSDQTSRDQPSARSTSDRAASTFST